MNALRFVIIIIAGASVACSEAAGGSVDTAPLDAFDAAVDAQASGDTTDPLPDSATDSGFETVADTDVDVGCVARCDDRECGDDGCGASCGECDNSATCSANGRCTPRLAGIGEPCEQRADCAMDVCLDLPDGYCSGYCTGDAECPPDSICYGTEDDGEGICIRSCARDSDCRDGYVCDSDDTCWYYEPCASMCDGRECGDDGCGATCGTCGNGLICDDGQCVDDCVGSCAGRVCGDDGCGASCGTCGNGLSCTVQGQCVVDCAGTCVGRECGDDGCGVSCGSCGAGELCNASGQCVPSCVGSCAGRECGDDGCGVSCGSCGAGELCNASGQCVPSCVGSCAGRECGDDGCGVSCGSCGAGELCNAGGQCVSSCVGSCAGRECGDDGCGVSCGSCGAGELCNAGGQCVSSCVGSCAGRECGDDGCGVSCGSCGAGELCNASRQCECVPRCDGKNCGSNGCGGTCGACSPGETCDANQVCQCAPRCDGKNCGDDGCGGVCGTCGGGQVCGPAQVCEAACSPSCGDNQCGDDGCDGVCGTCSAGFTCNGGQCLATTSEPPSTAQSVSPAVAKAGTSVVIQTDVNDTNNDHDKGIDDIESVVIDLSPLGGGSAVAMQRGAVIDTKTRRFTTNASTTGRTTGAYHLLTRTTDKAGHVVYDTVSVIVYTGVVREVGPAAAYTSISAGIAAAAAGDFVRVAGGTWVGAANKNLTVGKAIVIAGAEPATPPTIDCESAGRAFHLRNSNETAATVIAYMAITHCNAAAIRLVVDDAATQVKPSLVGLSLSSNTNADNGGALVVIGAGAEPTLVDVRMSGNAVTGLYGGAMYIGGNASASVRDGLFVNNAASSGGAIYVGGSNSQSRMDLIDTTFRNNAASGGGGAMDIAASSGIAATTMVRTHWFGNSTTANGGALRLNGLVTISQSEFREQRAGNGGAIAVSGGGSSGNCLSPTQRPALVASDSEFTDNFGADGGAIHVADHAGVRLTSLTFRDNRGSAGGGVSVGSGASACVVIERSDFLANQASTGGGVHFRGGGNPLARILRASTFVGNVATSGGGAVYLSATSAQVDNLLLLDNQAQRGGGIYLSSASATTVRHITTVGNAASLEGPGLYFYGSNPSLLDSIVVDGIFVRPDPGNDPILRRVNIDPTKVIDTGLRVNDGNGHLVGADGNIFADPLFVAGPRGAFYLSQTAAGQPANSPCLNPAGGVAVDESSPVWGLTTRTDGALDTGTGDLGYHYAP